MTATTNGRLANRGFRSARVMALALAVSLGVGAVHSAPADARAKKKAAVNKDGKKYCELHNTLGGSIYVEHGHSITTDDPDGDGPRIAQTYWCNDGKWDTKKPSAASNSKPKLVSSAPTQMQMRR